MAELFDLLQQSGFSLAIKNKGKVKTFGGRGVSDLYRLYTRTPEILQDAEVADKVVGKAAAALMILGGVRKLSTGTVSRLALDLLKDYPVEVSFRQEVPHIINRNKTGWCPMESRCKDLQTPQACLQAVADFILSQTTKPQ
ncbi:MAG: DUF1893 domain-containing protein [Bacteroides sp.]|nr:DUF1893 domain-containing protein [Ruminococcus flavefaciens]MCM1555203.1 DUF1893 domain-containing protein [Bacteroides sp.]